MKFTVRMIALALACVCCLSTMTACDIGLAEKITDTTDPTNENAPADNGLSPAELYRALFEAGDFIAVAQLDVSNAPKENMLRKVLHKDEGRLLARTETYDGTTAKRSTSYLDLDHSLRYTETDGKWGFEGYKGGKEALEESLNELLKISERISTDPLFKDENYEKADENGCASLKESVLQTMFSEGKYEATYTKAAEPDTYTLYAMVLHKGERHTLTLTVRLVDATVELPEIKTEEPKPENPLPPEDDSVEKLDPPTTDIPEVDPTDAKALIDRADYLMGLLHSFTAASKMEMVMELSDETVVFTRIEEVKSDIVCKRVRAEASNTYAWVDANVSQNSFGMIYYDQDVYMMYIDGDKQIAPMNDAVLDGLIGDLTAVVETDLSMFGSVTITEDEYSYYITLTDLIVGGDLGEFLGGLLDSFGEMEVDYDSFQMQVDILKDTGLYNVVSFGFDAMVATEDGNVPVNVEAFVSYMDRNKTTIKQPATVGYVEVPLESLIG